MLAVGNNGWLSTVRHGQSKWISRLGVGQATSWGGAWASWTDQQGPGPGGALGSSEPNERGAEDPCPGPGILEMSTETCKPWIPSGL